MWKVRRKKQDPALAYFSIKGVVWVGVGNNRCPFLPLMGGSWKLMSLVWHNTFHEETEVRHSEKYWQSTVS